MKDLLQLNNRKTSDLIKMDKSCEHTVFQRKRAFSSSLVLRGMARLPSVGKKPQLVMLTYC